MRNPGRAFARDYLLEKVWGYDYGGFDRTVDTHVLRLRKKLGASGDQIETVWGVGYRLAARPGARRETCASRRLRWQLTLSHLIAIVVTLVSMVAALMLDRWRPGSRSRPARTARPPMTRGSSRARSGRWPKLAPTATA